MNILSRRKRLLNRTPKAPKMSSRRQFHRALRRHPAWPAVMEQAAARARAQGIVPRGSTGLRRFGLPVASFVRGLSSSAAAAAWRRSKLRRNLRRNRVLVVTLLVVGGLMAVLTGISMAQGEWVIPIVPEASQPPSPRFGAATTLDEANGEVLIFGGFVGTTTAPGSAPGTGVLAGPPIVNDGETWALKFLPSGRKWFNRTQSAIHSPSPRGFASMAYDGARKNVVLFGGAPYRTFTGSAVSGETWTWDGKDWTLQNPPGARPNSRQNASMVYDAHRKVVVMFGGRGDDNKPLQDTWIWNGSAWKIMPSAGAPSPRHSAAMAYNVCRAEAVMFGGVGDPVNNFTPQPGETWIWDGAKWRKPDPPPRLSPPSRIGASMVYSPVSGRVLLHGGLATTDTGQSTVANDTDVWRWTEASATGWERMNNEVGLASNANLVFGGGGGIVSVLALPPRAYGSFTKSSASHDANGFNLFGGTPYTDLGSAPFAGPTPQVALGDQYAFTESGFQTDADKGAPAVNADTPLRHRCDNPVPVPPDEVSAIGPEAPKVNAREGMREIAQLPVLLGTDWPHANRNTHLSSPTRPNPNYVPPPDCPNRNGSFGDRKTNVETGSNTHLATDGKRNRIYQFFICDTNRGATSTGNNPEVANLLVEAYDGVTLKPVGRAVLPNVGVILDSRVFETFLGDKLLHDVDRGRFVLHSQYWNGSTTINELVFVRQDLIEKGVNPVVKRMPSPSTSVRASVFSHPKTGRAKLLIPRPPAPSSVPGQTNPPRLGQWDLENNSWDWEATATGCAPAAQGSTVSGRPMRSGNKAYIACYGSVNGTNHHGVVRIPIVENPDGSETPGTAEAFAGPDGVVANWGDPQAERMLLLSDTLGGEALWVFDGKTSRYVGRAGISSNSPMGLGFDQEIGRFYAHLSDYQAFAAGEKYKTEGGLLVLDGRLTPVPQGVKFPQFSLVPATPVAALPSEKGAARRVFIRGTEGTMQKYPDGEAVKMSNEMFYRVLADEVPVSGQAELAQLDALTIPVTEKPGKTEVSFDAEGSGYGIRLRSIGGVWSAVRPFQQIYDQGGLVESLLLDRPRPAIPACVFPDRELMAGWVPQARLSDLDALARSTGLDVDSNSKSDLEGPFSRCNPTANASLFPPSVRVVFDVLWPLWQLLQCETNRVVRTGMIEPGTCLGEDPLVDEVGNPLTTAERVEGEVPNPSGGDPVRVEQENPFADNPPGGDPLLDPVERPRVDGHDTGTGTGWGRHFKEVECVGDALATNTATVGNIYGSAECVQRQGLVKATARGSASGAGPAASTSSAGFSVGEGYSNVTVGREPAGRGVVVTSTAIAKDIELPNLTIGYVKTEAVAWSNGRPGEGRASFTRKICNVDRDPPIPINPPDLTKDDRAPSTGCLTPNQQKELVNNWNTRWGINSKMSLPTPDSDFYKGSPGGYIAGVIKPVPEEIEDQFFARDYQREVPGLVIEFVKDSQAQGPARQSLMLAAVRAVAGLGVQCNPDHIFSPQSKDCLAMSFEDDLLVEEFEEEEEFTEDAELDSADGFWEEVEASLPEPLALGKRIGRFIENLPILRLLPIREFGEALLAFPVWLLLGLPLLLASRRFALNQAQRGD